MVALDNSQCIEIDGLVLHETCYRCPEQYDVYKGGKLVSYFRIRHGEFTATCPDVDGEFVYQSDIEGDGRLLESESDKQLRAAVVAVKEWLKK